GQAMVAIGDVSVMPHSWRIWTPCLSSKVRISDTGTAEPPQATSLSDDTSWPGSFSRQCMTSFQMVGTAPATVGRSSSIMPISDLASRWQSGSSRSAPALTAAYGSPQPLAWNIGTIGSTQSLELTPRPLPLHV